MGSIKVRSVDSYDEIVVLVQGIKKKRTLFVGEWEDRSDVSGKWRRPLRNGGELRIIVCGSERETTRKGKVVDVLRLECLLCVLAADGTFIYAELFKRTCVGDGEKAQKKKDSARKFLVNLFARSFGIELDVEKFIQRLE